jgi:ribose/xylose/arabinose/galactoside ABC-type transport system permease subunit
MTLEKPELQTSPKGADQVAALPNRAAQLTKLIPLFMLVAVFGLISLFVPYFFTLTNFITVLVQCSALAVLAIGETAVLITGGIDLSVPGMMALGAIFGAMYMKSGGNILVAIVIMLVIPTLLGAINGLSVSRFGMIPFVVTLAMQAITSGAAIWVTNSLSISGLPQIFTKTMLSKVWIIPVPVIILFVIAAIVQVFLTRSIWGRWLYATGTNMRTSRVSGIPTARVIFLAYAFSGLMAGLAGVILTARLSSAGATMGKDSLVLDIVSSAALGGVSIMGGVGTAVNAVIGAILITLISNVMNMANVSYYLTLVVKGVVVVIVVAIDAWRRRR